MSKVLRCSKPAAVIACLALMLPALASSAPPSPPLPAQDSVRGSGSYGSFCTTFDLDAQSGSTGEDPIGQLNCGGAFVEGGISCLNIQGNVALLAVLPPESPFFLIFRITDNGPIGDTVEVGMQFEGPACAEPPPGLSDFGFSGDLVVVDAPPLPTAKEQCNNGGWRNYGVFKNQGDCVSSIATGGRNHPAG